MATVAARMAQDRSAYYEWSFPGAPVRIDLKLTVVGPLRDLLESGLQSDPGRPVERGGLLLGIAEPGRVVIMDVLPFGVQRQSDRFTLSALEKLELSQCIDRQNHAGPAVVGYFRSDLRGGICLQPEDVDLIAEFFPDPDKVFLVMGADGDRSPVAGFFFWDSGSLFTESTFLSFPLNEALLRRGERIRTGVDVFADPGGLDVQPAAHPSGKTSARRRWWMPLLALAAVAAAAGTIAYRYRDIVSSSGTASPAATSAAPATNSNDAAASRNTPSPLALLASRLDRQIVITWDAQSRPVAQARIGVLSIKDGATAKDIALTTSQLQMQKIVYAPLTDQVSVTMEVFSGDGTSTRESMLVLVNAAKPQVRTDPGVATSSQRAPEPESASFSNLRIIRQFVPPAGKSAPLPQVRIPDAPTVVPATNVPYAGGVISSLSANQTAIPRPTESTPTPQQSVTSEIVIQPAQPLRQVTPILPTTVFPMLKNQQIVQVRLRLNEQGKIIEATATPPAHALGQYLAKSAVEAARAWKFAPARKGSTPVSSEYILRFIFGPTGNKTGTQ